jgi:hypothetical protein
MVNELHTAEQLLLKNLQPEAHRTGERWVHVDGQEAARARRTSLAAAGSAARQHSLATLTLQLGRGPLGLSLGVARTSCDSLIPTCGSVLHATRMKLHE